MKRLPRQRTHKRTLTAPEVIETTGVEHDLLVGATPLQLRWVAARIMSKTDRDASRKVGISMTTAASWTNKERLDAAVNRYLLSTVEAARTVLLATSFKAAGALERELDGRRAVEAAKAILDRAGIPGVQKQEIAGGLNLGIDPDSLSDAELERIAAGSSEDPAEA